MAGNISYPEFLSACRSFIEKSNSIGDAWQGRTSKFDKDIRYLVCKSAKVKDIDTGQPSWKESFGNEQQQQHLNLEDDTLHEDDDACKETSGNSHGQITFEYHVIYNESFSVPVLYFSANTTAGKCLSLAEVWNQVPKSYEHALEEKWSLITQTEHPILGYPVFHIHPCNTSKMMEKLAPMQEHKASKASSLTYLIIWLSALGPIVGLKMSLEYFKMD